jgi:hypothetical protein
MQMGSGVLGRLAKKTADAGRRVIGLAFGKAIAFTYAVIVSVVANVLFEFVREPPHPGPSGPMTDAAFKSAAGPIARAPLPAASRMTTMNVKSAETAPSTTPPGATIPEPPHPGPGSGGLY